MRKIDASRHFQRKTKSFLKKYPKSEKKISSVLRMLQKDIFSLSLNTHKLSGKLKNFYACDISYEHRLIFYFDEDFVYLLNIGSHDELY